jgi:glycosyltransferase involved in cell wall biosynthesis
VNQTYSRIEVVVVEDGGSQMQEMVEGYRHHFENLVFVPLEKSGRSPAGNAGLAKSTGRCLCFLDDDDLLLSDHVETLVNSLATSPAAFAAAALAMELPTLTACAETPVYRESGPRYQHLEPFEHHRLWNHNLFPIQTVLFRREVYHLMGGFDESLDALEDWDLWMRYSMCGAFVRVPKSTSAYRIPGDPEAIQRRQKALDAPYHRVRTNHGERVICLPVHELTRQTDTNPVAG